MRTVMRVTYWPMSPPPPPLPPAVPPRPRRTLRTVLIVVGIVVAICCMAGVALGVLGFNALREAVGPAQDTVESYLTDVESGRYAAAYDRLCAGNRARLSLDEFTRIQDSLPKVRSHEVTGVQVVNNNGRVTGQATVHLVTESGAQLDQIMYLVKDGGDWKVCQPGL